MLQVESELAARFRADGFAVLRDALTTTEVDAIREEATRICRGDLGTFPGLEPAPRDEGDDDLMRRYLCIHFPHKISGLMRDVMKHPVVVDSLTQVIGPNVKCMQSMLFIKASGKPGQAWHQDEYFIPTRDRSLTAAWIALDDATVDNGCLWAIPGSHTGIIWPQREHGDFDRFDCAGESYNFPYTDDDAVAIEVGAGSVVLFNGYLLHRSLPNRASGGYRRALVNHFMSAESLLPWFPEPGRGVATTDYRDIVLVAGEDPYAWKGTEDRVEPHVRPSGEGGCGSGERNLKRHMT